MTKIIPFLMLTAMAAGSAPQPPVHVSPDKMPRIATVSERYQSYNIEMAELTGGQFWKPFVFPIRPPELDDDVAAFDITEFTKPFPERLV